jgi:hypothetical protein
MGLLFLRQIGCRNVKHEILPGAGYDGRGDLAAKWFGEEVLKAPEEEAKLGRR